MKGDGARRALPGGGAGWGGVGTATLVLGQLNITKDRERQKEKETGGVGVGVGGGGAALVRVRGGDGGGQAKQRPNKRLDSYFLGTLIRARNVIFTLLAWGESKKAQEPGRRAPLTLDLDLRNLSRPPALPVL